MIVELGQFALRLALCGALLRCVLPLWGANTARLPLARIARPAAYAHLPLLALAYGALTWAFIDNDFSVVPASTYPKHSLLLPYTSTSSLGTYYVHNTSLSPSYYFSCAST